MSISIYSTFISRFYLSIHLSIHPSIILSFCPFIWISLSFHQSTFKNSMNWWTDGMDFAFSNTIWSFFFGVKKMIREHSIRMPLRSCRTLLLDTWLMAFTTESFMAPKLANPKKIDNSFAPVLTWCCFGFFRVARRFCIALSSGNYSSWLASGQQQRGKNRSNLSHAQFSLPRAHISG
jgi:hypothetical protein